MTWSQLERQVRRLTVLPRGPKAVFKCLAAYGKPDGTSIYPSIKLIVEETDYCERSVRNFLRWLEREGWIVARDTKGGRGRSTLYHIPLNDLGIITPQPLPEPEPLPAAKQERKVQGILKKNRLSEERRHYWQAELARVQREMQFDQELEAGWAAEHQEMEADRRLAALEVEQHQALLLDFDELERAYFDACTARGMLVAVPASAGAKPPAEQVAGAQLDRQAMTEQQRLNSQLQTFKAQRASLAPDSRKGRFYDRLILNTESALSNLLLGGIP